MDTASAAKAEALLEGGERIGVGPMWLARLWSGGIDRILSRIDKGLDKGLLRVILPDGTQRRLGGRGPGFDAEITLLSPRALLRVATEGSIGCYQGWEAGEWSSPDPMPLFAMFMDNAEGLGDVGRAHGPWRVTARMMHWLHRNTRSGAARNIHAHYDLGNDFYAAWLDQTMSYSSARFDGRAQSLEAAQECKIAKLVERLKGAHSVLEIGCGWGSLARAFADQDAEVTAISLSDEQLAWARERHGDRADFRKVDYRDIAGQFDGVVSCEMVEAVGREYWPAFFDCIARCLKPGGRAAIQYILIRDDLFDAYARSADFIQAYVFPGGMLIRESEFRALAEARGLAWADRTTFGLDYAATLMAWRIAFDQAAEEGRLPPGFDARFARLWRFYLMYCEGGFRGGGIDVAQVTLIKQA